MKKILLLMVLIFGITSSAAAASFTFSPNPSDLWDLDHNSAYSWGIDWDVPDGEYIVGATLSFDNIENWKEEPNDLWVDLMDTVAVGAFEYTDYARAGDYFLNQGILIGRWEDLPASPQDILYTFNTPQVEFLRSYAADGNFGFGFDPDCHYYNDGIALTIETAPVPEPATMLLFGMGLLGVAGVTRKKISN